MFDKLFTDKVEELEETLWWEKKIKCVYRDLCNARAQYPRYKFTVKTDYRTLKFQIVVGDPVTLCTTEDKDTTSAGLSVCKRGDTFSIEVGIKNAIESAIYIFRHGAKKKCELSCAEKEIIGQKVSEVLQKAREWNS